MNRRTVLRRLGAVAGASAAFGTGLASASDDPVIAEGATLDVSDVSGRVSVAEAADDPSAVIAADVDPSQVMLLVDESAGVVTTADVCGVSECCNCVDSSDCPCSVCYCLDCFDPDCELQIS